MILFTINGGGSYLAMACRMVMPLNEVDDATLAAIFWKVLDTGNFHFFDVFYLNQVQNVLVIALIQTRDEHNSVALTSRATCPANPMHIVFRMVRNVIVEDVADGWDIKTACCNV